MDVVVSFQTSRRKPDTNALQCYNAKDNIMYNTTCAEENTVINNSYWGNQLYIKW